MRTLSCVAVLALLAGCASEPAPPAAPTNLCSSPRPQVCTMEYNPVCGELANGGRADYASACNACADEAVTRFEPGTCPK